MTDKQFFKTKIEEANKGCGKEIDWMTKCGIDKDDEDNIVFCKECKTKRLEAKQSEQAVKDWILRLAEMNTITNQVSMYDVFKTAQEDLGIDLSQVKINPSKIAVNEGSDAHNQDMEGKK